MRQFCSFDECHVHLARAVPGRYQLARAKTGGGRVRLLLHSYIPRYNTVYEKMGHSAKSTEMSFLYRRIAHIFYGK